MKLRFPSVLLALFLGSSLGLYAQQKTVLFDAMHAQTAGNADWTLDEDSCGTAQRYPTPDQAGITSSTAETYWSGAHSAMGVDLVKKGFHVESLPIGARISYNDSTNAQDLKNYNVFVMPEPNIRLTATEITAIRSFVQNGGGLLMIADHAGADRNTDGWEPPQIFNELMGTPSVFGFTYGADKTNKTTDWFDNSPDDNYTTDTTSPIIFTGPFGSPSAGKGLGLFGSTSMTITGSNAKGHVWMTSGTHDTSTRVTYMTATYGSGRVAAVGDSSITEDKTNDCGHTTYLGYNDPLWDNGLLIANGVAWLANGGSVSTYSISGSAGTSGATITAGSGSATSDGSNNYSITGLAAGTYTVTPSKSGCTFSPTSRSVTISSASVSGINFTATCGSPTYTISGSAGTSGATVTAGSTSSLSDASNHYSLAGFAPGTYIVTPSKSGCTFSPSSASATISSGNVTINFTATCGSGDTQLTSGVPVTGQSVALNAWKYYYITVPAGATDVTFTTTSASADVDIYTQFNAKPTTSAYVCAPYTGSGNETCSAANPSAGTWWVGVYGYAAASFTVTGTVTTGSTTLFTNGFESSSGWATAQVSGTAGAWTYVTSGTNPTATPHGGSTLAKFNSYDAASGSQTRVYRSTGFAIPSSAASATLKFWMYHDTAYTTSADKVQLQVSTGSTWTNVGTAVNRYDGSTGWKQHTIDLSSYKGSTVQLGFVGISAYGNNVFIDDVTVTVP